MTRPLEQPERLPRIVGRWYDGVFYVDDLSRVMKYDEVALIDLREHQAIVDRAVKEAEVKVFKFVLAECRRKTVVYEMPNCGHSAYSSGATDSLAHLIKFIEEASEARASQEKGE